MAEPNYHMVGRENVSHPSNSQAIMKRRGFLMLILAFLAVISIRIFSSQHSPAKPPPPHSSSTNETFLHDEIAATASKEVKIKSIHLLGERHSGADWLYSHLTDCFADQLPVEDSLTRDKEWFQYESKNGAIDGAFVITLFRNPYDWIEALREKPLNSPLHHDLDWKTFVTKKWAMPRWGPDLDIHERDKRLCAGNFAYNEIVPCSGDLYHAGGDREHGSDGIYHPRYELKADLSGDPYDSVVDLRADKIQNFLSTKNFGGVVDRTIVRFEDLVIDGTSSLLQQIERVTGTKAHCQPIHAQKPTTAALEPRFVRWMNENANWSKERLLGYQRIDPDDLSSLDDSSRGPGVTDFRLELPRVTAIHFIGERHSGTNWIYDHLIDCFASQVPVLKSLSRFKHWMQWNDNVTGTIHNNSLAIAIFRNSFEWVEAFRQVPYSAPNHKHMSWKEFVTTPWTMDRWGSDLNITDMEGRICKQNFRFVDVIPCSPELFLQVHPHPLYELKVDGSGEPYDSVIHMRRDKILNFLDAKNYDFVSEFIPVRFEDFVAQGSSSFLRQIVDATGLTPGCEAFGTESRRRLNQRQAATDDPDRGGQHDGGVVGDEIWKERYKERSHLDKDFVQWMNENVDWEVEGLLGYEKREL